MEGVEGGDMNEFFNWLCSGSHGSKEEGPSQVGVVGSLLGSALGNGN